MGNIPQLIKYEAEATYETFDKLVADYGPVVFIQFGKISQGIYKKPCIVLYNICSIRLVFLVIVQDLTLIKEVLCSDIWVDRFYDGMIAERSYGKVLGN